MSARLSRVVRDTIKLTEIGETAPDRWGNTRSVWATIAGYVRAHYPDGDWSGDRCGCPDDRCIGYHHDEYEDCGCFEVLLDEHVAELRRQHLAVLAGMALAS